MDDFDITEHPVFDRFGRQVGTDKIKRHKVQPKALDIAENTFRVHCACGAVFNGITNEQWADWPQCKGTHAP